MNQIQRHFHKILGQDLSARISRAGMWSLYFIGIGVIAGIGAIIFHYLCQVGIHFFMDVMAGYRPLTPAGEHHLFPATTREFNRWILLLLPESAVYSGHPWLALYLRPKFFTGTLNLNQR